MQAEKQRVTEEEGAIADKARKARKVILRKQGKVVPTYETLKVIPRSKRSKVTCNSHGVALINECKVIVVDNA